LISSSLQVLINLTATTPSFPLGDPQHLQQATEKNQFSWRFWRLGGSTFTRFNKALSEPEGYSR
jgi:hypothetical protein